jgi:hypothetical protein
VEEIVMGLFMVFPLSIILATLTIRIAAAGWRPSFVRSDVWTTLLITIVGDIFLEILLPWLRCLPMHTKPTVSIWIFPLTSSNNAITQMPDAAVQQSTHFMLWMFQTGLSLSRLLQREQLLARFRRTILRSVSFHVFGRVLQIVFAGGAHRIHATVKYVATCCWIPNLASQCSGGGGNATVDRITKQFPQDDGAQAKKPKSAVQQQQQQQQQSGSVVAAAALGPGTGRGRKLLIVDTDSMDTKYYCHRRFAGERTHRHVVALVASNGYWRNATTVLITTHQRYTVHPTIHSIFSRPWRSGRWQQEHSRRQRWIDRRKLGHHL